MRNAKLILAATLILIGGCVLCFGCAQETGKNKAVTQTEQEPKVDFQAPSREFQKGPEVHFYIYNAPARGVVSPGASDGNRGASGVPASQPTSQPAGGATQPNAYTRSTNSDGTAEALASYAQSGFVFNLTIGNTEGTTSAAHNVSATGGSQSSPVTTSTDGTQKPTAQTTVPVTMANAPGSSASGGSVAPVLANEGAQASGGQTASSNPTTGNSTQLKVPSEFAPQVLEFLKALEAAKKQATLAASTQPAN